MNCFICKKEIVSDNSSCGTGYGRDANNNKVCYACCGERDKQYMRDHNKMTLYFSMPSDKRLAKVSNWPESLVWENVSYTVGGHNWGLNRYDCWFWFEGFEWHGVCYGDNTQILHCKKTKNHRSFNGQSAAQLVSV